MTYLALLRGINVGGRNKIPMADLKACFEAEGFDGVTTYIQSGNVVFEAKRQDRRKLTKRIEDALAKTFSYEARVVLRSHQQLKATVAKAPKGFGSEPDEYRYNVIFLKEPRTAAEALKSVTTREGVDEVSSGPSVLYFSNLMSRASQSHLSRIPGLPIYKDVTIRNWNTTTKLLALMDECSRRRE